MLQSGSVGFLGHCPHKMLMLITLSPQEDHIDGIDHGASCSPTAAQHMLMADAFIKKSPKKGEARP